MHQICEAHLNLLTFIHSNFIFGIFGHMCSPLEIISPFIYMGKQALHIFSISSSLSFK